MPEHRPAGRGSRERRALRMALVANAALLVVEAAGGLVFGSLVLLADAGHLLADVSALGVSAAVSGLARRRPTARHTFGFERAEVLAAQVNALLLVAVMAWIAQDALRRLAAPPPVRAGGMLAVAVVALAVNGASSVMLARAAGRSLNMRGAYIHLAVDAAGSLTAIAAAAVILGWGLRSADPVASLVTAALAAWPVYGLIRDTTHVLMEGAPRGLDPEQVQRALLEHRHVVSAHHLHLWSLASDVPALSAHVVLAGDPSIADAQRCAAALRAALADRFGIVNVTLELESEPQAAGGRPQSATVTPPRRPDARTARDLGHPGTRPGSLVTGTVHGPASGSACEPGSALGCTRAYSGWADSRWRPGRGEALFGAGPQPTGWRARRADGGYPGAEASRDGRSTAPPCSQLHALGREPDGEDEDRDPDGQASGPGGSSPSIWASWADGAGDDHPMIRLTSAPGRRSRGRGAQGRAEPGDWPVRDAWIDSGQPRGHQRLPKEMSCHVVAASPGSCARDQRVDDLGDLVGTDPGLRAVRRGAGRGTPRHDHPPTR